MKPLILLMNQRQSVLGLFGSVLVFAGVVSAPAWLVQQEEDRSYLQQEHSSSAIAGIQEQSAGGFTMRDEPGVTITSANGFRHAGQSHYQQFCASCHGMPGMERIPGLVGSDLFDGVSERPFTRDVILLTLQQGILDKGMLPMQALLSETQMEELIGYLIENQPS